MRIFALLLISTLCGFSQQNFQPRFARTNSLNSGLGPAVDYTNQMAYYIVGDGQTNNGSAITIAFDRSGNNWHGFGGGTDKPIFRTSFAGTTHSVIQFTNSALGCWIDLSNKISTVTIGEAWFVVSCAEDPPGAGKTVLCQLGVTGGTDPLTYFPYTDGIIYDAIGTTSFKTTIDPAGSFLSNTVYRVKFGPSAWTNSLNSTNIFGTGANTVGLPTTPALGAPSLGTTRSFNLYEFRLYTNFLTAAQEAAVFAYYKTNYPTIPLP